MTLLTMRRPGSVAVAVFAMLATMTACSGGAASPSAAASAGGGDQGTVVNVSLKEFSITFDRTDIPAGKVTFNVTNHGTMEHEFVVFKTDLAADSLPIDSDEPEVDEDDPALTSMGEVEDIEPGETKSFSATLDAAKYVGICNVPGHYASGMYIGFDAG